MIDHVLESVKIAVIVSSRDIVPHISILGKKQCLTSSTPIYQNANGYVLTLLFVAWWDLEINYRRLSYLSKGKI